MLVSSVSNDRDVHLRDVSSPELARREVPLDFATLYDAWFEHVTCWLQALGAPSADIEDLAQDVFLVVRRRLCDFDGRNLAGWLYRISNRQLLQHRRRRWIQSVITLGPMHTIEDVPDSRCSAVDSLQTQEKRLQLEQIIRKMSKKRGLVFRLFEVEDYTGEEIANMLDVPVNTVWTRLHHARKDFFALLAQYEREGKEVS
jgi:RNA polymerase sigma-70 factor (ECF subfamily)